MKRKHKTTQNSPDLIYLASEEKHEEKSISQLLSGLIQPKSAGSDGREA